MTLQEILNHKGSAVQKIGPDETMAEVVRRLMEHRIGSLVVCGEDSSGQSSMRGIITERDVLRAVAEHPLSLDEVKVSQFMSADPLTGTPLDDVADVMGLMTNRRIRHLPVLEADRLIGIISIGDVVKAQHDQIVMENHYLKSYLNGGITAEAV